MKHIYYVYVIKSEADFRLYVGLSKDISKRVKAHNSGQVFSTKGYRPWKLVYEEKVGERLEARKREKFLKHGSGKELIKRLLQDKALNEKLKDNIPR